MSINYKGLACFIIGLFLFDYTFSQELKKIIPPSPTVAALGKYGDIPVGYYTGSPSISIPLYEIKTSDFSLPISLSYHSSGVKVEEMASWVGLGWSLNAGGIITRSQRGGPDEINGYMDPVMKVSDIMELDQVDRDELFRDWINGGELPDTEPDMFFYNIGSYSGKFYYNQETEQFVCIPQNRVTIDKSYFLLTGNWRIKAEDGTEFHFTLKEQNTNYSACDGSSSGASVSTTGWFLTKVITAVSKEEINFYYNTASYQTKNISSHTLRMGINGSLCSGLDSETKCDAYSSYAGYRLASIQYNSGKVEFEATNNRTDLIGDKSLDNIKIYSRINNYYALQKKFRLDYSYFNNYLIGQGGYNPTDLSYLVRLKLNAVTEIDVDDNELRPYSFEYNETYDLPSRLSYDQDNWGFYNGPKNNQHMVPPFIVGTLQYPGADRNVDTLFTAIGSLWKINYPTGGSTEFQFENHSVFGYVPYSSSNQIQNKAAYLDIIDDCDVNDPNPVFCESVTFQNQLDGGVFLTINVDGILNCSFCPQASSCAVLSLESTSYSIPITCNVTNLFIPNGVYTLKANFTNSTDSSVYQDFAIALSWKEISTSLSDNFKVGGIRVKKIIDKDGNNVAKSRTFKYETDENISSGVLVTSEPVYEYGQYCYDVVTGMIGTSFYTRTSVSNLPLGMTQGSHIGYGEVSISTTGDENGKTIFYYTTANEFNDVNGIVAIPNSHSYNIRQYPFAPVGNFDHRRGLLIKQEEYEKVGSQFVLQKAIQNEYDPLNFPISTTDPDPGVLFDQAMGIKIVPYGTGVIGGYAQYSVYITPSEWVRPVKTTESFFNPNGSLAFKKETTTEYDNTDHLQPTLITTYSSDSTQTTVYNKYPLDYTIPAGATDLVTLGIKKLQNGNFISPVIESFTTRKKLSDTEEKVVSGVLTTYYNSFTVPRDISVVKTAAPIALSSFTSSSVNPTSGAFTKDGNYKKRIEFIQYDSSGNLLHQRKASDTNNSYIWGYDDAYPIAEVLNTTPNKVFHTSFESDVTNVDTVQSMTGRKSRTTSYTVNLPSAGTYKLTYWKKVGAGAWELVETTISSSTAIGGSGILLDEVRVFPAEALMTTYTFNPGVGVTTITDANNVISYYVYDSFGRLKLIKDNKGNILKVYKYHYKDSQDQSSQ